MTISRFCPQCKKYARLNISNGQVLSCPHCQNQWGTMESKENVFERCPICTCRQFYIDKDFNQVLGLAVIAVGIVLVPKTYGLSLPVVAFIDWMLYRKVANMAVCYRCGSEFRGFATPNQLKPFMHPIGLKYDRYR